MIYKLQLSTKEEIILSELEYVKFKENISANFIEFERGIVNPSFVVSIIIDEELTKKDSFEKINLMVRSRTTEEVISELKTLVRNEDLKSMKRVSELIKENLPKLLN